jgi:thiosulfate reductase cytochrome b subunit
LPFAFCLLPSSFSSPRHSALVRVTHWLTAVSFVGLLVSGIAILLAYPRLHWGETGTVGTPSLIDLPLPFVFGPSGWGRYLHFLSAWVCVLTGVLYVLSGLWRRHFTAHFAVTYNVLQRLAYTGVVFLLFPLMIWSGLAMSPAITSVSPYSAVSSPRARFISSSRSRSCSFSSATS